MKLTHEEIVQACKEWAFQHHNGLSLDGVPVIHFLDKDRNGISVIRTVDRINIEFPLSGNPPEPKTPYRG